MLMRISMIAVDGSVPTYLYIHAFSAFFMRLFLRIFARFLHVARYDSCMNRQNKALLSLLFLRVDLPKMVSLFGEAARHIDTIGIHQWDGIYPDRQILLEDVEPGILQVGALNGQLAVIFGLEECAEEDNEKADWNPYPERIVVRLRLFGRTCFKSGILRVSAASAPSGSTRSHRTQLCKYRSTFDAFLWDVASQYCRFLEP